MITRRFLILFAFACAAVALGFGQTAACAQTLGISPAFVDAKVKRGVTYNKNFTISNNTGTRLRFHFSAADYWYDESNRRVDGRPGTLPRSASLWVQFSPVELIIAPGGTATARAIISVPQTASGGYYTSPIFEAEAADAPTAPQKEGTATASVAIRLAGLIMFTTEDSAEYNVEMMGGQVVPPSASTPLEMHLDLRNRSTAHATLRGKFAIFNAAGALVGRGKVDDKRYMPGQRDILKTTWAGELAAGHYTAVITLSYDRAGMEPASLVYELPIDVR